ncbi:MAG TPA: aldo/keto reductase, partial [Burkholderiales bacterium]|nr:aldo/keto reductase [Burkholderiales bacterium]
MKYVFFPEVGLKLSQLAFGCAPVMGKVGRRAALTAMNAAHDQGVTHFDVARSYGYGEAEAVLGAFARGKRDRITIATKFGIAPRQSAKALRVLKPAVRAVLKHVTLAKSLVTKASSRVLATGRYDLDSARASFEESLRQLGTDYVDILFLHDCSPQDALGEDLLAWLDALVAAGKTRAWGIATHRE